MSGDSLPRWKACQAHPAKAAQGPIISSAPTTGPGIGAPSAGELLGALTVVEEQSWHQESEGEGERSGSSPVEHADQLAANAVGGGLFGAETDAQDLAALRPQVCDDLEAVTIRRGHRCGDDIGFLDVEVAERVEGHG